MSHRAGRKAARTFIRNIGVDMKKLGMVLAGMMLGACGAGGGGEAGQAKVTNEAVSPSKLSAITAPAGRYQLDPNHASLRFSVKHVGLADYYLSFTDYDMSIVLAPEKLAHSSVSLAIRPLSVRATYSGDYKATHKQSPFSSWEEALARSPKFLDADQHPEIVYESTAVTALDDGRLQIDGNLSLRGQTHPVRLYAKLTGVYAEHPFTGKGALGFSAQGEFSRSQFGMDHLVNKDLVSDRVVVQFDGEFHEAAPDGN